MIENDKVETEDKRVMVDIKMMDCKTLLDIKAFFFWNDRLTSFPTNACFLRSFTVFCLKAKIEVSRILLLCVEKLQSFRCLHNCLLQCDGGVAYTNTMKTYHNCDASLVSSDHWL